MPEVVAYIEIELGDRDIVQAADYAVLGLPILWIVGRPNGGDLSLVEIRAKSIELLPGAAPDQGASLEMLVGLIDDGLANVVQRATRRRFPVRPDLPFVATLLDAAGPLITQGTIFNMTSAESAVSLRITRIDGVVACGRDGFALLTVGSRSGKRVIFPGGSEISERMAGPLAPWAAAYGAAERLSSGRVKAGSGERLVASVDVVTSAASELRSLFADLASRLAQTVA